MLVGVPDDILSKPLLSGDKRHCIKDLLFHIPSVEDGWLHEDILRETMVLQNNPSLRDTTGGAEYAEVPLSTIVDYWKTVEQSTLAYLSRLTEDELARVVTVHDSPTEHHTVDGLLWHVLIHEMRHTAQIVVLLRTQNIKPPALDLLFYLPSAS